MTRPARIPADVNRPDRVLGPFTARQSVILVATAAVLYLAWTGLRAVIPLPIFLAVAVPLAAVAVAVALGQRDGLPLDRFLAAALRHRLNPHRLPDREHRRRGERPGPAGLFTNATVASMGRDPAGPGVLDLGADGLIAVAVVSTLNLGLRTPAEQDALVAGFARYLHTLTGPIQFLIRTVPVDLTGHLAALYEQARLLPHPALVAAALGHSAHLNHLATPTLGPDFDGFDHGLLTRQVLLVLREPAGAGGGQRLLRRLDDATGSLAALDMAVTPLPAAQLTALLADCGNPDQSSPDDRYDAVEDRVPVAIVRRHPEPELDDVELQELFLAQDQWSGAAESWDRLPPVPTHHVTAPRAARAYGGAVDFTLAGDVDDTIDGDFGSDVDGDLEGGGAAARWWGR